MVDIYTTMSPEHGFPNMFRWIFACDKYRSRVLDVMTTDDRRVFYADATDFGEIDWERFSLACYRAMYNADSNVKGNTNVDHADGTVRYACDMMDPSVFRKNYIAHKR